MAFNCDPFLICKWTIIINFWFVIFNQFLPRPRLKTNRSIEIWQCCMYRMVPRSRLERLHSKAEKHNQREKFHSYIGLCETFRTFCKIPSSHQFFVYSILVESQAEPSLSFCYSSQKLNVKQQSQGEISSLFCDILVFYSSCVLGPCYKQRPRRIAN